MFFCKLKLFEMPMSVEFYNAMRAQKAPIYHYKGHFLVTFSYFLSFKGFVIKRNISWAKNKITFVSPFPTDREKKPRPKKFYFNFQFRIFFFSFLPEIENTRSAKKYRVLVDFLALKQSS